MSGRAIGWIPTRPPKNPPIDLLSCRCVSDFDEDKCDDEIDPEGPDESEMDYSDEPDLEICPNCRKLITEEAHQCPHCGEYVAPGTAPLPRWAWIVIAVLALVSVGMLISLR